MTHCVDAPMEAMKATRACAVANSARTEAELQQLPQRDHAMLPRRKRRDLPIHGRWADLRPVYGRKSAQPSLMGAEKWR